MHSFKLKSDKSVLLFYISDSLFSFPEQQEIRNGISWFLILNIVNLPCKTTVKQNDFGCHAFLPNQTLSVVILSQPFTGLRSFPDTDI